MAAIFPGATKGSGQCFAAPDTCLTPAPPGQPTPVPYPNTAMMNQTQNTSVKVKFVGKEVVTLSSKIPKTMGDEAGSAGGIMSGMIMGEASFKMGSTKVKVEGNPCIYLTSMTGHNGVNSNAPAGMVVTPSQTKVIVSP